MVAHVLTNGIGFERVVNWIFLMPWSDITVIAKALLGLTQITRILLSFGDGFLASKVKTV